MLKVGQNAGNGLRIVQPKDPLRLTALLYLREALVRERYEHCAEIVRFAKEFGAADYEIRDLLEDPRRRPG